MCNYHLIVSLELRLYPTSLPIPKDDISGAITTTDPLSIRRKADLTRITSNGMPPKMLFVVLTEVIGVVDKYLVVQ
jgi:hypothetical protein